MTDNEIVNTITTYNVQHAALNPIAKRINRARNGWKCQCIFTHVAYCISTIASKFIVFIIYFYYIT